MDENYRLVRRIMLSTNRIDGAYYLFARHLGENENALAFLYALADGRPHSQKEISDEWLIPRTTVNSIVKGMLREGYVAFCTERHSREKALVLTESGRRHADRLLADIYAIEEKAIAETLKSYPPEFVSAMEEFSGRLYEAFQAAMRRAEEREKHE